MAHQFSETMYYLSRNTRMSTIIATASEVTVPQASMDLSKIGPLSSTPTDVTKRSFVGSPHVENDDEDSEADDSEGSLVDFIVRDNESKEENEEDDNESVESEPAASTEDALARELDGISAGNIVVGKRKRRPTQFYERTVFDTDEYRKMMLDDVPEDEMHAIAESDDDSNNSENDDSEDDEYEGGGSDDDDDDDDDDTTPTAPSNSPRVVNDDS